jgi:hypothetical protein
MRWYTSLKHLANGVDPLDYCRIHPSRGSFQQQMDLVRGMLSRHSPRGSTPLARWLSEVYQRIDQDKRIFCENGQQVFVSILTDGQPDGGKQPMIRQMRRLVSQLPVCIVIRLCTDEEDVVEFYNGAYGGLRGDTGLLLRYLLLFVLQFYSMST